MLIRDFKPFSVPGCGLPVLLGVLVSLSFSPVRAAEDGPRYPASPNAPDIVHAPLTTAIRGVPVDITATIQAMAGSTLTQQVVLVRLSDVGTPIEYPMTSGKGGGGVFHALIPVTAIKGVSVFWYAIDARDSEGRIGGTLWYRVVIIEPVEGGGSGGGGAGGGSGEGAGGAAVVGGSTTFENAVFVVGGILLAGGAAAVIIDDDGGSGGGDDGEPEPEEAPPGGGGGNNDDPPPSPPANQTTNTCLGLTGDESVSYENLSSIDNDNDILILVCGTCPNATIEASGSWEVGDVINGYNNPGCSLAGPRLVLPKPVQTPTPGTFTVTVFANGQVIEEIPWPPLEDFDLL